MNVELEKYKGIHPGLILEHELKKRNIAKSQFAIAVDQQRQTLNEITKGRRKLPVDLSFKIDKELGYKGGTMLMMQTYYEIEDYQQRNRETDNNLDMSKLRKGLFWDTEIQNIDAVKHVKAIIRRVFERGNDEEKSYITQYYGEKRVAHTLKTG